MKPEEAIDILDEVKELDDSMYAYNPKYMDAVDMAIEALKEVQLYRLIKDVTIGEIAEVLKEFSKIGTVEECLEAVEEQKVKYIKIESYCPAYCPTCRFELSKSLGDGYYEYFENLSRCPKCGQKICWDEDLEGMEDE